MQTVDTYLSQAIFVRNNIEQETERIIFAREKEITNLNKLQFIDGYGSDDKDLFNSQRQYKGIYSPNYKKQGLYDFFETGTFINGLYVNYKDNKVSIDSKGKGTGEKSLFFAGYSNLFGLDTQNQSKLNYQIILPELQIFINKHL